MSLRGTLVRVFRLPNAWLLAALIVLVLVYPFLDEKPAGRAFIAVFDLAILVLALRASRSGGSETRIGYFLVIPAMGLHAAAALGGQSGLIASSLFAQAVFHGFVVFSLMRYMLRDEYMTLDELFAAAALYVLMAFVFGYLYALLEHQVPGSFYINEANNAGGLTSWFDLLYFSFTCLTSVGFGEVTPVNDHARSLVMVEQTLGVLYLALVISRLVALQSQRIRK